MMIAKDSIAGILDFKPSKNPEISASMKSAKCFERNAGKPCSKCGHPKRHISKSGRCFSSLCTSCYQKKQESQRAKRKE